MKATPFVLSLVLAFMIIGVLGQPTPSEEFDKNYLALQWPQSFCSSKGAPYRCQRILPHFTIHGLWPQKENRKANCSGKPEFNYGLISGNTNRVLLENLNKFWPNLTSKETDEEGNKGFWRIEWERHGTCTTGIFGNKATAQRDYFYKAVALAKMVGLTDPDSIKRIIVPGMTYTTQKIKEAIEKATRFIPRLKCNKDKNGTHQLLEVILCVVRNATGLKNCTYDDSTCPTKRNSLIAFPNPIPPEPTGRPTHEDL